MAKLKIPTSELMIIRHCLEQLGDLNTPIPYELAKNLRRVNAALKEPEELIEAARKEFIDKDAAGEPIQYALNKKGEVVIFDVEQRKNFDLNARVFTDITDKKKHKEYKARANVIESDSFEVDFHEVKMSKLKEFLDKQGAKGNLFEPLIERIFIETE